MGGASCKEAPKESAEYVQDKDKCITAFVVAARGLREPDKFPGNDRYFYCTVGVHGKSGYIFKTRLVKDTPRPTWKEAAFIGTPHFMPGDDLEFDIFESNGDGRGNLVASAVLKARDFQTEGFHGDLRLEQSRHRNTAAYVRIKLKLPGQPYPDGPVEEFTVFLDNPLKQSIGLDFDAQDGSTVYIVGIKDGLMANYNEDADPNHRVQEGDFIVRVNEWENDAAKILDALRQETSMELLVRRPVEIFVALEYDKEDDGYGYPKPHRPPARGGGGCLPKCGHEEPEPHHHFGLEFPTALIGDTLMVQAIMDGPVEDWNAENPEQAVRLGDRIVAVNGKRGKSKALLHEMKASTRFTLTIHRAGDFNEDDEGAN